MSGKRTELRLVITQQSLSNRWQVVASLCYEGRPVLTRTRALDGSQGREINSALLESVLAGAKELLQKGWVDVPLPFPEDGAAPF